MSAVTRSRSRRSAGVASAAVVSSSRIPDGATVVTGQNDTQGSSADTSSHVCGDCGKAYGCWHHYRRHLATHLYEDAICPDCDACSGSTDTLSQHQSLFTGEESCQHPECGREFFQKSNYITKCGRTVSLLPVSTSRTDATANTGSAGADRSSLLLKGHARIPHGTSKDESKPVDAAGKACGLCRMFFSRFHKYRRHLAVHAYEELVAEESVESKVSKDMLDKHQRRHKDTAEKASAGSSDPPQPSGKGPAMHDPRPVVGEVSTTSEDGARNGTGERSQQCACDVCRKVFVCQYRFRLGLPPGSRYGGHICPECLDIFEQMGRLRVHRRAYTG